MGFYLLGLPLAGILMFNFHMDIYGFWLGMIAGESLSNVMLFALVWRFDWDNLAREAFDRAQSDTLTQLSNVESLQLLPHKYDNTNHERTPILPTLDQQERNSGVVTLKRSLFQLHWIKVIIIFLFICLFVISARFSFQ